MYIWLLTNVQFDIGYRGTEIVIPDNDTSLNITAHCHQNLHCSQRHFDACPKINKVGQYRPTGPMLDNSYYL